MFGSLFYNLWAALFSFAVYFIVAIQDPFVSPWPTLGIAFLAAGIGFVAMYGVRLFIGYVFYTPEAVVYLEQDTEADSNAIDDEQNQQFVPYKNRSTAEFEEDNTEEVAQVVRTMLHGDEAISR